VHADIDRNLGVIDGLIEHAGQHLPVEASKHRCIQRRSRDTVRAAAARAW
jgi:hypothetical protein